MATAVPKSRIPSTDRRLIKRALTRSPTRPIPRRLIIVDELLELLKPSPASCARTDEATIAEHINEIAADYHQGANEYLDISSSTAAELSDMKDSTERTVHQQRATITELRDEITDLTTTIARYKLEACDQCRYWM